MKPRRFLLSAIVAGLTIIIPSRSMATAEAVENRHPFPPDTTAEEQAWVRKEAPLLECPDRMIEDVYYFRWGVYRRHLKSTSDGWVVTEFLDPQPRHVGKHGTLSDAAGHHLYEGRWLRTPQYLDEYSRFWFTAEGAAPRLYSEWLADAIWSRACVTGNFALPQSLLPKLIANYRGWEEENLHASGLYWSDDLADAMEISISGNGFRPTVNSYQYGNARAIARIARRSGDEQTARTFDRKAEDLQRLVQEKLWDPAAKFFKVFPIELNSVPRAPRKNGRMLPEERSHSVRDWSFPNVVPDNNVRELIGFLPWYFNLPKPDSGTAAAWNQLDDPSGFWALYGPTTAERRHPRYRYPTKSITPWNGQGWAYATSQTLTAMAHLLRDYPAQSFVTNADYYKWLKTYAGEHYAHSADEPAHLWIHEVQDPDTGEWPVWEYRKKHEPERLHLGKDYNHSTFNDLVISGLLGVDPGEDGTLHLRPLLPAGTWSWFALRRLRIWGHDVDVVYDRDGTHFSAGAGLRVSIDGQPAASRADLGSLDVKLTASAP